MTGTSGVSPFTIGIEEEYLLVDPESGELVGSSEMQEAVISDVQAKISDDIGFITPEFLKAQVEVGTAVATSVKDVREKLRRLRLAVTSTAEKHGVAAIAASTHPTAKWQQLQHTDKERYNVLANDLQEVARRLVICGMHVHVGIDDDEHRIDLLGQIAYFLPHLLALSTSSPFWQGRDTGLKCYRLSVFDELPRTGLPERFSAWTDYERHLDILVGAGLMEDASKLWWDIRPHFKFPTLEMRVPDICTRMDDGICVAAVYACLLSMLQRLRRTNQRWRNYSNMLIQENRWRAQRYGLNKGLVDFGIGEVVEFEPLFSEIVELTMEDAERLDCVEEVRRGFDIIRRGTSAHRQLQVFESALADGADEANALKSVVDWLIAETKYGLEG